jgi:hypothetical protein
LHGQNREEIAFVAAYRSGKGASRSASVTSSVFLNKNERIWCEAYSQGGEAILKDIQFSAVLVSPFQFPLTFSMQAIN